VSAELCAIRFFACRKEALWLLNLVLKEAEQSSMYGWLELLSCLVTVARYIKSLYKHLPFNRQSEGCLQLHCVSFSLIAAESSYKLVLVRAINNVFYF